MPDPKRLTQSVHDLIEDTIDSLDLELVGVEYVKEGAEWILRITIDKDGGISHEDCRKTSLAVEPILDARDIIKTHYNLEVSSPGLDRPLITDRDLGRAIGQLVEVTTSDSPESDKRTGRPAVSLRPHVSLKPAEGILQEVTCDEIVIVLDEPFIKGVKPRTNGQTRRFLRKDVKMIRRAIRI
ncbi:MAG: ribosome maturation factor RimP [Saccharofermentanales bacterium]